VREAEVHDRRSQVAVASDQVGERAPALGDLRRVEQAVGGEHDVERTRPLLPFPPSPGAEEKCRQLIKREAERVPAVPELERATERARAPPAEPDRNARLRATRIDDDTLEPVVRPGIGGRATAECRAQRGERILVARAAAGKLRAEQRELLRQRADPTPRMSRPPERRSSVPYRFASASG